MSSPTSVFALKEIKRAEIVITAGERMDDDLILTLPKNQILLSKPRSLNQPMVMVELKFIHPGSQIPPLTHQNPSQLEKLVALL